MPGNIVNLSPAQIAKWPPPNYVNPPLRNWMPVYAGVLFAVTTVFAGLRLSLRAFKKQSGGLGADDMLLVCSWFGCCWLTTLGLIGTESYMINRHIWDVPPHMYENIARAIWIAEFGFLLGSCCVKVSVLMFYRRLVDGLYSKYWVWALIGGIVFTVAYTLAMIFVLIFNCQPTNAYWRSFNPDYTENYHCANTTVNNVLSGVLAAVSDMYALAIPWYMTRNFTLAPGQKFALNLVFSCGFLVVAAAILRTVYLYEVGHESDVTHYIYNTLVWSLLELDLAIICASAPSLRVLFRDHLSGHMSRFLPKSWSARKRTRLGSDAQTLVPGLQARGRSLSTITGRAEPPWCKDFAPSSCADVESGSRSSEWSSYDLRLVRTPTDSETYDLHAMLKTSPSQHENYELQRMQTARTETEAATRPNMQTWSNLRHS